jgi:lipoprotein-anchoring transpeptidase ErfK/SrfK
MRNLIVLIAGLGVLAVATLGGCALIKVRAGGSGVAQALAPFVAPRPGPGGAFAAPQTWTVGKATKAFTVYRRPDVAAPVLTRLGKVNVNGYPTLVLVSSVRNVGSTTWYRVYVAIRPNESRGWVREGSLAFYTTTSKIVIHLGKRTLSVIQNGAVVGTYKVAVGQPGLSTPTGTYFINQKLRPSSPGGPYGVLALGTSAYQPKLSYWPQGGPVGIHGTNEPWLIGKAISHGCVRMRNKDILAVNQMVPAGSPVIIEQ